MKFFCSNTYDGCFYYRCYLPMLFNGFSGDKESFGQVKDSQRSAKMSLLADTVIFQRPDDKAKLEVALMLKKEGKKIVFENDDTYKDLSPVKVEGLDRRDRTLDSFIKLADLVTTTTEYLADEYRKLNKNVVVLKNCINPDDWPEPKRNEGDKIRIGLFGSAAINGDSEVIKDLLKDLGEMDGIQLVAFGTIPKKIPDDVKHLYQEDINFWSNLNVEYHSCVPMADYFNALNDLRLDIVLIPRKDNYFNRCKSNLKFLESSMLEIPVIAQGFEDGNSPYQGKEDSKYMLISHNLNEWKQNVYQLINAPKLRKTLGKNAKEYVLNVYDIKKNYRQWSLAYKSIK